jgi:uncharacterized phage-associated protein
MQAPPYRAITIAKWLIAWADAESEELSNMKLQKLLYFAQGHHLARHSLPLFLESLQAWSHGPVVPSVYRAFRDFGATSITLPDSDPFTWDEVDPVTADFLGMVWNTYGGYSAGRLRNMTHEEPPWRDNWRGEDEPGMVIPVEDMKRYFSRLEAVG